MAARERKPRKLSTAARTTIVVGLATYKRPSEIQRELRELYALDVTSAQIAYYNPDGASSAQLAKRWVDLHAEARRSFLEAVERIPIANEAYRLQVLNRLLQGELDKERMNVPLIRDLLRDAREERAAKLKGAAPAGPDPIDQAQRLRSVLQAMEAATSAEAA